MTKRFLLILPLALALTACGSSGNDHAATTAATTQTAATAPAASVENTAATSDATTTSAASAGTSTAPASSSPAVTDTTAAASSTTTAKANNTDAAAKAARAKAARNFVDNGKWVEGKDYFVIQPQQPKVTNTDKIEVAEVFSYGCPACNAAHKTIDKLAAELPPYATMAYLPAGFRPDENWVLYQRAYYAAQALGIADKTYDAMFNATWKTGETATYNLDTGRPKPKDQWPTLDDIAKFYSQYGVSADQFKAVANSFTVNTKIKRADKLIKDYGVPATPTIVIDGKYRFSFVSVGSYEKGIELAKWLVAKEAAGK